MGPELHDQAHQREVVEQAEQLADLGGIAVDDEAAPDGGYRPATSVSSPRPTPGPASPTTALSPSGSRASPTPTPGGLTAAAGLFLPGLDASWLGRYDPWLRIGIVASGLVFVGWAWVMPRKTWAGVQILAQVRGFQEFLERAEKDRLERMPPDTLHRWLPWPIALSVTERWIFNFQGLKVAAPTWYQGRGDFALPAFAHELTAFARRTEEAILTTRRGYGNSRRSGSGGSGFSSGSSGRGMGGGGGGTF